MSRVKWIVALGVIVVLAVAGIVVWNRPSEAWRDIPAKSDYTKYTMEERVDVARAFAKRRKMSEETAFFVDYSIESGTPRFYVVNLRTGEVEKKIHVMHGAGGQSTAEKPEFSNKLGSKCSSLGRFLVSRDSGLTIKKSRRLVGLDMDNQTAQWRGLMIHAAGWVDKYKGRRYIPLNEHASSGCVTIAKREIDSILSIVDRSESPILLWTYN